MKRSRLIITWAVFIVALGTLAEGARESDISMDYGSAPIQVGQQPIYVKARDCGAICNGVLWISKNPDRCVREDATKDYVNGGGGDGVSFRFATQSNSIFIVDDPRAWEAPTGGDWLRPKFIPEWGHAQEAYQVKTINLSLKPCIRIFGMTLN